MDEIDIVEELKLEPLVNEQKCLTLVEVCTAVPQNSSRKKIDQRLLKGYRWLLDQIIRDYHILNMRVECDAKDEAARIEQLRRMWRLRMLESCDENGIIIPDSSRNCDIPNAKHVAEWAHQNGVDKSSPERPSTAGSMTKGIKEQLERKSAKQRQKKTRKNKVQPLNDDDVQPSTIVYQSQIEEHSLAFQALTSPRGARPKELPPLRRPSRPSTSRSLGNEGTAWDLHKELEVVDTVSLGYNSDKQQPHIG